MAQMEANSPELIALRDTIPAPSATQREEDGGESWESGQTAVPSQAVSEKSGPQLSENVDGGRGVASTEGGKEKATTSPAAGQAQEAWPSFGAGRRGLGENRRESGGARRGRRPVFMRVGDGGGCGDPNCGGMC